MEPDDIAPGVKLNSWWEIEVALSQSMESLIILVQGKWKALAYSHDLLCRTSKEYADDAILAAAPLGPVEIEGFLATPLIVPAVLMVRPDDVVGVLIRRAPHNVFHLQDDEAPEVPDAKRLTTVPGG